MNNARNNPHLVILGGLTLLSVLGIVVLSAMRIPVPDILSTIAIAAASAVAGLAIPSSGAADTTGTGVALTGALQALVAAFTTTTPAPAAAPQVVGAAFDPSSPSALARHGG